MAPSCSAFLGAPAPKPHQRLPLRPIRVRRPRPPPAMAAAADVAPRPARCLRLPRPFVLVRPVRSGGGSFTGGGRRRDERFGKEEHYEWFKDFFHFRHLLAPLLSPSLSVLEVGCGNSRLGEELLREGVASGVTCVDLSPVAVQRMRDRLARQGTKGVEVVVADVLDLPFEQDSFDPVIEKNHVDVLFVDSDPWNPNPTTVDNVMKMLEDIHRVLKPEGVFVSITFGQPHFRRRFFEAPGFTWNIEYSSFGDGFHYFLYTLKKGVINYSAFVLTLQWLDTYFCNIAVGSCCSFSAYRSSLHRLAYFRNHLRA
ncbi:hypothetical protein ACP4OV_021430 [Aristida adscensionis]